MNDIPIEYFNKKQRESSIDSFLSLAPEPTAEELGRKQSAATKAKIAKSMSGAKNPAYKDGRRSYREKVGAKPGQLVDHKDGDSKNNSKSNLKIIPKSKRGEHDKKHKRHLNFKATGGTKKVKRGYVAKRNS